MSCVTREDEIVILPEGFTGLAVVIYDQNGGVPVKYHEKKRVYEIPSNGILKTQFTIDDGWGNLTQYYYKEIAEENRIENIIIYNDIPNDRVVASAPASGSFVINVDTEERIYFARFHIGNKSQIDKAMLEVGKLDTIQF